MDWKQVTEMQNKEFEFLDSIDLKPYLKEWADIYDVRDKIEEDYGKDYCEPFIFNCIDIEEFMDYLKRRYKNKVYFNEHTTYSIHLNEED
ncbi:hypothetical protein [uncultured Clostridium sp.]|uniref:hypothetical protein n=1 Tax=uncultured Clostridium sp. TaxID=59620 RepID=UPI0026EBABA8|nr:hypothetical protein [uncultured Clostridium sp.]